MIKRTCLLDSGINVKNTSLPGWEMLSYIRHSKPALLCPYKDLSALTHLLKGRRQSQHRSSFCIFILLLLFPALFTRIRITKAHRVEIQMVTCKCFFSVLHVKDATKDWQALTLPTKCVNPAVRCPQPGTEAGFLPQHPQVTVLKN